jgi:hypothetical protein
MGSVAKLMLAQTRGSSAQTRLVRSCDVHDLQVGSNRENQAMFVQLACIIKCAVTDRIWLH